MNLFLDEDCIRKVEIEVRGTITGQSDGKNKDR